ncbi:probable serine/threonine-protein kinase PBL19 [Zingiber officinale]|uniref:probable serine/threonine-protein kinase PBL19 n=1 Tax=Zingiber officinale TaxID=94328 RepID=UPI001C4D43A8|nr:probable serine/threonine-protein kinase PBL19 [Zingiber officinale]
MACFSFLRRRKRSVGGGVAPPSGSYDSARTGTSSITSGGSSAASGGRGKQHSAVSSTASQRSIPDLYEERAHKLRAFDFDELRNATNDFSRMNKIGEGGFGSVYKAFLRSPDGKGPRIPVAIKKLNQKGLQGHKQWLAEVQFLAVFEHPNLVKLLGFCAKDGERGIERLLVYEFMPNKSLEDHLFNKAYPPLPWSLRLQIALGVAEGLAYLHDGEVQVIYRDFKASNVLLDREFKAKLSDFGLAREGPTGGQTHVTTAVVGTYGYAAPDYIETGHLTIKSDVWSFGVVLYEVLTGRRSLERNRPMNEQKLLEWVKQFPVESRKFSMIIDPKLKGVFSPDAAREIAKLANRCLVKNPKERPSMGEVVECLKSAIEMRLKKKKDSCQC